MTTETHKGMMVGPQRGVAMIIALFTIVIILAVALAVLTHTVNAAASAGGVEDKDAAFNAAEAGLNQAIYALDATDLKATACLSPGGTLNTVAYDCVIVKNNLTGPDVVVNDPGSGCIGCITVPKGSFYIIGKVSSSGKHPTYVEAIATPTFKRTTFNGGVNGVLDVFDSCNANALLQTDIFANDKIFISGPGLVAQGYTYGYNGDQLPGCAASGCATPPPAPPLGVTHCTNGSCSNITSDHRTTLPSPSDVLKLQKTLQDEADTGGPGPQTLAQWCPSGFPCTINGNAHITDGAVHLLSGQTLTFTGDGTIYFDGDVTIAGTLLNQGSIGSTIGVGGTFSASGMGTFCATATDCSSTTPNQGQLYDFSPDQSGCKPPSPGGCAVSVGGNSLPIGFIYTPFGSQVLGGNGNQTGSANAGTTPAQSGGNVFFQGCGSGGGFTGVPGPTTAHPHTARISSYWEY